MVRQCKHANCDKQPAFGLELKKPTHCKTHATADMKDVITKRCDHPDCESRPTFGLEPKKPTHCKTHATAQTCTYVNNYICNIQNGIAHDWHMRDAGLFGIPTPSGDRPAKGKG